MRHSPFRMTSTAMMALAGAALALSACGGSGPSTASTTSTSSAVTPSTRGSTAPTPPTTAPGQLPTTASTPKVTSSGKPPCLVTEKIVSGHLAVTIDVPGPALVQVKAPNANPPDVNAIVNKGSGGVVVYMNTSTPDNALVTVVKNRQTANCEAAAP